MEYHALDIQERGEESEDTRILGELLRHIDDTKPVMGHKRNHSARGAGVEFDLDDAISAAEEATAAHYGHYMDEETGERSLTGDQLDLLGFGLEAASKFIGAQALRKAARAFRDEALDLAGDEASWLLSAATSLRSRADTLEAS